MTDVNTDTEALAVRAAQIARHRATRSPARKGLLARLGPGLITGASDDDPSGIATYSQAGAQFGYAMCWVMLFCFPLMVAIQEISARISRVTGQGIAGNIRAHYSPWLLRAIVGLLLAANIINLGADLGAMAAALKLLVGGPIGLYVVGFAIGCTGLEVFVSYERYVSNRSRLRPHEQHILSFAGGAVESYTLSEMPTNINRYLFRTPDMSVASTDRDAFTYSKLGPFIILGFIAMPPPKQWVGTKVNVQGGTIGPRHYVLPKPFDEFIFERANRAVTLQERLSEKQTAKIAGTYKADLDRTAQSDSMRVMHQDVKLFGSRAFKRR